MFWSINVGTRLTLLPGSPWSLNFSLHSVGRRCLKDGTLPSALGFSMVNFGAKLFSRKTNLKANLQGRTIISVTDKIYFSEGWVAKKRDGWLSW